MSNRGFTLIEGVFSTFLIFLVLGSLAYTLQQAGSVKSNMQNMGELSEVVQAMSLIRADAAAADVVSKPDPGSSATELELRRIDPDLQILDRINVDDDFDPFETSEQSEVRYFSDSGILKRRYVSSGGQESVERLLPVQSFQVERESSVDTLTISFEITNSRRARQHTMKVALR